MADNESSTVMKDEGEQKEAAASAEAAASVEASAEATASAEQQKTQTDVTDSTESSEKESVSTKTDAKDQTNTGVENGNSTTDNSEPSSLESKIIRQVEYYFGDANMERDKFLKEEVKKDDGWVTLTTLLTFNRLKAMSDEASVITTALKKSTSGLLEIKADDSAIRRHPTRPLPSAADSKVDLQKRILYVKGFPTDISLDDLIDYFDGFGGESVSMRKDAKRNFKGSVFIRFKTEEQAKAYLEPEEMKYKETTLVLRLYKDDYFKKKQKEKLGGQQEEVKRKEEMKKKKEQEEREEFEARVTRGALLKVTGVEPESSVEKLKEYFGKFGKIAWVDHNKGDDHAIVRFGNENEAKTAWDKAVESATDGKVMLNEKELTASCIEGADEDAHWKKIFESMRNKYNNKGSRNKFGQRGGHRGGRGGFKKRSADGDANETAAKKAKAEDG